jgi:hypothetical protein
VGDASVDFQIRRDEGVVKVEILRKSGNVEIVESL